MFFKSRLEYKFEHIIYMLITGFLALNVANVQADSLTLKETQTDKLKCKKYGESKKKNMACDQFKTGKHSITVKLSSKTLEQNEIFFQNITTDTLFKVSIGDYQFSNSLSNANSSSLTDQKLESTWNNTHKGWVIDNSDVDYELIDVKHGTVNIKVSPTGGATIKIIGNRAIDEENNYGDQILLNSCKAVIGKSNKAAKAIISIGESSIELNSKIRCDFRQRQITKKLDGIDETFTLENIGITGKLAPVVN